MTTLAGRYGNIISSEEHGTDSPGCPTAERAALANRDLFGDRGIGFAPTGDGR